MRGSELKKALKEKRINNVKRFNPFVKKVLAKSINTIGKVIFFSKRNKNLANIQKILFISLYFNGDIIFQSPLFELIGILFPNAEMHIWVKSRTEQMVRNYPYFKKIFVFNDIRTRRYDENVKFDVRSKLAFFKDLRKEKYDLIFDLAGLFWTAFAVFYALPGYSVGFNFHGFGFIYNFETEAIYKGHLVDKNLNLVTRNPKFRDLLKRVDLSYIKPKYYISENSRRKIDRLFSQNNITDIFKSIVIHTSAGWKAKIWEISKFIGLINQLDDKINVFLIGGKEDEENAKSIKNSVNKIVYDFIGQLNLNESAEVIRRADLFIGCDSGPLYIAEAVGTRTLSLFGPTNPLFSAPRGNQHEYIYKEIICSAAKDEQNCKLMAGLNCKTYDCMKMINPEEVIDRMLRMIS